MVAKSSKNLTFQDEIQKKAPITIVYTYAFISRFVARIFSRSGSLGLHLFQTRFHIIYIVKKDIYSLIQLYSQLKIKNFRNVGQLVGNFSTLRKISKNFHYRILNRKTRDNSWFVVNIANLCITFFFLYLRL